MNAIKYQVVTVSSTQVWVPVRTTRRGLAEFHRREAYDLFDSDEQDYKTPEEATADAKTRETGWKWEDATIGGGYISRVYTEVRMLEWDEDWECWEQVDDPIAFFFDEDNHFGQTSELYRSDDDDDGEEDDDED